MYLGQIDDEAGAKGGGGDTKNNQTKSRDNSCVMSLIEEWSTLTSRFLKVMQKASKP